MKHIITDNQELLEVLAENGISLICDNEMRITITEDEAEAIPAIIAKLAPAASADYTIENI